MTKGNQKVKIEEEKTQASMEGGNNIGKVVMWNMGYILFCTKRIRTNE